MRALEGAIKGMCKDPLRLHSNVLGITIFSNFGSAPRFEFSLSWLQTGNFSKPGVGIGENA